MVEIDGIGQAADTLTLRRAHRSIRRALASTPVLDVTTKAQLRHALAEVTRTGSGEPLVKLLSDAEDRLTELVDLVGLGSSHAAELVGSAERWVQWLRFITALLLGLDRGQRPAALALFLARLVVVPGSDRAEPTLVPASTEPVGPSDARGPPPLLTLAA